MLKLQSPSKYSPFDAIHLSRCFFHCSKQFLNLLTLMPFSASAIFVPSLPCWQNFPFEDIFHAQKHKKVAPGEVGWIGRVEHRPCAVFGQKLLNTQHSMGRCAHKSPIMKWAKSLKESSKNALKLDTASHNNASWYTDTDGFLEHSPSWGSLYYKGPTLQKIILFWGGGAPLYVPLLHCM